MKIKRNCVMCGTVFGSWPSSKRKYCSTACYDTSRRGRSHEQYKNAATLGDERIFTSSRDGLRYVYVKVREGSYPWKLKHRIIVEAVYGPLPKGTHIHHVDGDSLNNAPSNLLVCTEAYHHWLHWRMSHLYAQEHFGGGTNALQGAKTAKREIQSDQPPRSKVEINDEEEGTGSSEDNEE